MLLAFSKHFELGPANGLCEDLGEEAVAVAGDFESAVRRQLVAPRVIIEELRVKRNLGALLWTLVIGERHLRVPDMSTNVIDTGKSESVGQYNDAGTSFRIVSGE